jgi:hypothetical protein
METEEAYYIRTGQYENLKQLRQRRQREIEARKYRRELYEELKKEFE